MKTIALITARGGSVRLPGKNKRLFCGIPLVAWSIIQAKCSIYIDDIYLTTDDEEIAEIGKQYGANIILRPKMDNDISANYVLKLAIQEIENQGIDFDTIVYMLPTSPIKRVNDLDDMFLEFKDLTKCEELITTSINKETYLYRNIDGNIISSLMENIISDKNYKYSIQCGGWGIGKKDYLYNKWSELPNKDSIIDNNLYRNIGNQIYGYNVEPWQCFETDYENDFKLCELIMESFILKGQGIKVYTDYALENGKVVNFDLDHKQLKLEV